MILIPQGDSYPGDGYVMSSAMDFVGVCFCLWKIGFFGAILHFLFSYRLSVLAESEWEHNIIRDAFGKDL